MTFTPPNVRLVLRVDEGTGRVRAQTLKLGVEGIDSHQEIADLAYRLGAAAGLPYQRVVRNDPRDFEIELGRAGAPGFARVPTLDSRADYARNKVASAAAAATAQERVAPFDPATFGCDHKVTAWSPLREVRFEKPFGFAAVGCLPFAAAGFLAAPAVFVLMGGASTGLGERVGVSLFVGVFGLLIGGVSLYAAYSALPRRVVLDWSERTIRLGGLFRRQEVAFSDVTRLALKCVRVYHSGGKNSSSYHSYHCELHAHVRDPLAGGEKPLLLVETSHHREDPDTPYRQALPLVTELATALNVRREVIDYT
jgi:hypothetical protein